MSTSALKDIEKAISLINLINNKIKNRFLRILAISFVIIILVGGITWGAYRVYYFYVNLVKQNRMINISKQKEETNVAETFKTDPTSQQNDTLLSKTSQGQEKSKTVQQNEKQTPEAVNSDTAVVTPMREIAPRITKPDENQTPEKQIEVVSIIPQASDRYYLIETWDGKIIESYYLYFLIWKKEKISYSDYISSKDKVNEPDYSEIINTTEVKFQSAKYGEADESVPFSEIKRISFTKGSKEQDKFYFEITLKNEKTSNGYIIVPKGRGSWRFKSEETGTTITMGCWQIKSITFPKRSW